MKFKIENEQNGLNIEISETKGEQSKLLKAFQECKNGSCTCPTQEYTKLESLEVKETDDTIHIHLKSKPGEEFDKSEINKCLEYTENKIKK